MRLLDKDIGLITAIMNEKVECFCSIYYDTRNVLGIFIIDENNVSEIYRLNGTIFA